MDILTHMATGMAFAGCLALTGGKNIKQKTGIILAGTFGGILPDLDAISMWSRFDQVFGRFFGLTSPGKVIYSAKFWYSHHGFMHSLLAAFLFVILILFIVWGIDSIKKRNVAPFKSIYRWIGFAFTGGFIFHLLEDVVTPASAWGGVRFFFPSTVYVGGTGDIWWWNNYDIFLIVTIVFVVNIVLLIISIFFRKKLFLWGSVVFLLGFITATYQIKSRKFDFNKASYSVCEEKSKEIQQKLLPSGVYHSMEKLDRWLIIHF